MVRKRARRRRSEPTFAQFVQQKRAELGLTQQELGDLTGVSQRAIGYYEQGVHVPKVLQAKALAKALKVPYKKIVSLIDQ